MSEKARVQEYNNLYSMGVLPKIQGRYLTGPKPKTKLRLSTIKRSEFSMEHARKRLNMELRRIQVSQRISERSQRTRNKSLCRTEPIEPAASIDLNKITVKPMDMSPAHLNQLKKAVSLPRRQPTLSNSRQISTIARESIKMSRMPSSCRTNNSQNVIKAKFGKKDLEEEVQKSIVGIMDGVTIGRWKHSIEKTQNLFNFYNDEKIYEENLRQLHQERMAFQNHRLQQIESKKRQFSFKYKTNATES